ncbi:pirin family protein [Stappia stellulata]|uniref:pirin family protein n=1 Tax=Stappia stellulata TaxID=71235 RepID=UPI001CD4C9EE|nr:pirin family protein [Stappia stellulata]MCA1242271.1 pirin family protein [Stappia stellulata]
MQIHRPSDARGRADFGWLDSRHSFSFGQYYDEDHMGFGALRVINEDRVAPGAGFGTHPHRDMEILSYVVEGALEHKDSIGTGSVIRPGDLQRMSAGTGIRHSEYNHSKDAPVHFLQIWILPERGGLEPGYEQKTFPPEDRNGRLVLLGSRDGRDGSVTIHQDVALYGTLLKPQAGVSHALAEGRKAWIQLVRGTVSVNGRTLKAGDGLGLDTPGALSITAQEDAELLLFDLAAQ